MIKKYNNFKLATLQMVRPDVKSVNLSQKFPVKTFLLSFCQNNFFEDKSYKLLFVRLRDLLAKNANHGISRSVCFNTNIAFGIQIMKERSFCKGLSSPGKS